MRFSTETTTEVSPATKAPTANEDDESIPSNYSADTTSFSVQDSPTALYTLLVAGGSLGIVLRCQQTWKLQALKEGKTRMHSPYSVGQLVPERPKPTPVLFPALPTSVRQQPWPDNTLRHSRPDANGPQSPMTSATETTSSRNSWLAGAWPTGVSGLRNCVDDKAQLASHCHFSSSQVRGASGFAVTEGSMLGENRFAAAPVQKEEVVEFLKHSSPKPCLQGSQ
ncbi:hypothetical protein QTO34_006503 [Cnephaeus nilssonii]|uniref:Uncharacterized protein n=1 Tax=Cnephaeus nilssonii TaxID=3371016 RepID=A0AA40LHY6_CNENI|nr:hypothetical protein QTO34_006503 [Eptesicus nilssonii]